jgi:hypothetical protein
MSAAASRARRMEPEWLDALPAHDARARRSRDDLVRVNALMGSASCVAGVLREVSPRTVAEIGGGCGRFLLSVASRAALASPVEATILDREPCVGTGALESLRSLRWNAQVVRSDVFEWLNARTTPRFDAIVANLFLHHFDDAALEDMLAAIAARTRCFVAFEPRRSRMALAGARLLGLVGCNDVTRHDAVVSVRAGFLDGELTRLWTAPGWRLVEERSGPFGHRLVASAP